MPVIAVSNDGKKLFVLKSRAARSSPPYDYWIAVIDSLTLKEVGRVQMGDVSSRILWAEALTPKPTTVSNSISSSIGHSHHLNLAHSLTHTGHSADYLQEGQPQKAELPAGGTPGKEAVTKG